MSEAAMIRIQWGLNHVRETAASEPAEESTHNLVEAMIRWLLFRETPSRHSAHEAAGHQMSCAIGHSLVRMTSIMQSQIIQPRDALQRHPPANARITLFQLNPRSTRIYSHANNLDHQPPPPSPTLSSHPRSDNHSSPYRRHEAPSSSPGAPLHFLPYPPTPSPHQTLSSESPTFTKPTHMTLHTPFGEFEL